MFKKEVFTTFFTTFFTAFEDFILLINSVQKKDSTGQISLTEFKLKTFCLEVLLFRIINSCYLFTSCSRRMVAYNAEVTVIEQKWLIEMFKKDSLTFLLGFTTNIDFWMKNNYSILMLLFRLSTCKRKSFQSQSNKTTKVKRNNL